MHIFSAQGFHPYNDIVYLLFLTVAKLLSSLTACVSRLLRSAQNLHKVLQNVPSIRTASLNCVCKRLILFMVNFPTSSHCKILVTGSSFTFSHIVCKAGSPGHLSPTLLLMSRCPAKELSLDLHSLAQGRRTRPSIIPGTQKTRAYSPYLLPF